MSRTVPWSMKDLPAGGRAAAESPILQKGPSVGDWLDALIAEHASEMSQPRRDGGSFQKRGSAKSKEAEIAQISAFVEEAPFEMAATGTGGPLRRFPVAERQIVHVFETASEPRGGPADHAMAQPYAAGSVGIAAESISQSAVGAERSGFVGPNGRAKEQLIREAVAAITRRQAALEADLPPRETLPPLPVLSTSGATLGEIGNAISSLEARLADARAARSASTEAVPSAGAAAPLSALDEEASQAFATLGQDLRRAVQDIDLKLRGGQTVGGQDAHPAVSPAHRARSGGDLLSTTAQAPSLPGSGLAQSIPRTASADRPDPADGVWADVKTLLERLGPDASFDMLDRRMQDLAVKVERHLADPGSSSLMEDMSRRIDALQSTIKAPDADREALDQVLRGIEDRILKAHTASTDIQHIDDLMNDLARRIEASHHHPDVKALTALETQIETLGERLERSEANLSSLDAVEHSLRELFSQLEQTRYATIDAAENAARTAARDTLRAAMQSPVVVAASDIQVEFAEKITREVQSLKSHHDASDRRTQASIASLHEALDRLADRLAGTDVLQSASSALETAPAPSFHVAPEVLAVLNDSQPSRLSREGQRSSTNRSLADALIEPGEGRVPAQTRGASDPADSRHRAAGITLPANGADGSAPFIAAARRAAQAAQASVASKQRPASARGASTGPSPRTASPALLLLDRTRAYVVDRRRPILLSLAGLVLLLGALEIAKVTLETPKTVAPASLDTPAVVAMQAPPSKPTAPATEPVQRPDGSPRAPVAEAKNAEKAVPGLGVSAVPANLAPPVDTATHAPGADGASPSTKPPTAKSSNPFLAGLAPSSNGLGEGLKTLATSGDPAAQYEIGLRYIDGRTVNRDPKIATSWFEKAAAQGLAPAQYRLGSAFEKGVGEPLDPLQAVLWYGHAADAGNIRAMHNLAVMAAEGAAGKPDYVKAATLFGKAAALGVRDSQFNLAILYARGLGIEQNLAQSYTWFAVAAAQGDDDAAKKRDEVGARLDAKSLEAAKAQAIAFRAAPYEKSANEVLPPPGGWDAVPVRADPTGKKIASPKAPVM